MARQNCLIQPGGEGGGNAGSDDAYPVDATLLEVLQLWRLIMRGFGRATTDPIEPLRRTPEAGTPGERHLRQQRRQAPSAIGISRPSSRLHSRGRRR